MLGKTNALAGILLGAPVFTYTGTYSLEVESQDNWTLRLLTGGVLTFESDQWVDLCMVGGGAGGRPSVDNNVAGAGGGAGYVQTWPNLFVARNSAQTIVIGAGGYSNANGGASTALTKSVSGGVGRNGGSGAGSQSGSQNAGGNGGTNGSNGTNTGGTNAGTGQGTTTREFGEVARPLYAGGGGGGGWSTGYGAGGAGGGGTGALRLLIGGAGTANTGGGGGGGGAGGVGTYAGGQGGSGIVVLRNKR